MASMRTCSGRGHCFLLAALLVALAASGCDSSGVGRTVPVNGKVTVEDVPLTAKTTVLLFKPDASKGNTSPFEPTGTVDEEGNYKLYTNGKSGAPLGWYKVSITAREDTASVHPKNSKSHRPVARSLLSSKYGNPDTSGLSIEVVESPASGTYDLKLSK